METNNENPVSPKQRHGCVTAWLILILIVNSVSALLYLLCSELILRQLPIDVSFSTVFTLGLLGVGNVVFSLLLLNWKRIGFYGFFITGAIAFFINLNLGLSMVQAVAGMVGVGILYGILQIKKNQVSTWENLE